MQQDGVQPDGTVIGLMARAYAVADDAAGARDALQSRQLRQGPHEALLTCYATVLETLTHRRTQHLAVIRELAAELVALGSMLPNAPYAKALAIAMNTFIEIRDYTGAWTAWERMQRDAVPLSGPLFPPVIEYLALANRTEEALKVYGSMLAAGVVPTPRTFTALLRTMTPEQIRAVLASRMVPLTIDIVSAVVDTLVDKGDVDQARDFLLAAHKQGCPAKCAAITQLLHALLQRNRVEEALHVASTVASVTVRPVPLPSDRRDQQASSAPAAERGSNVASDFSRLLLQHTADAHLHLTGNRPHHDSTEAATMRASLATGAIVHFFAQRRDLGALDSLLEPLLRIGTPPPNAMAAIISVRRSPTAMRAL